MLNYGIGVHLYCFTESIINRTPYVVVYTIFYHVAKKDTGRIPAGNEQVIKRKFCAVKNIDIMVWGNDMLGRLFMVRPVYISENGAQAVKCSDGFFMGNNRWEVIGGIYAGWLDDRPFIIKKVR